jgi:hypothetical protein
MKRGVNSKLNCSGVPKTGVAKKLHHEEVPVEHLDTLGDTHVPQVGTTDATADLTPLPVGRSSAGGDALALVLVLVPSQPSYFLE